MEALKNTFTPYFLLGRGSEEKGYILQADVKREPPDTANDNEERVPGEDPESEGQFQTNVLLK